MSNDITHRFEVLKMARELMNEEYINRRAEDHNKWIAECDVAWKTKGIKLPYPAFAPYPSESEIIAKASTLYNFLESSDAAKTPTANKGALSKSAIEVATDITNNSPWETYLKPLIQDKTVSAAVPALVESPGPVAPIKSSEPVEAVAPTVESTNTVTVESVSAAVPIETTDAKPLFALPSWLQKTQK